MTRIKLFSVVVLLTFFSCKEEAQVQQQDNKEYKLTWADEFDYTGLPDSTKWGYDVGGHGWGNNELQFYTKNDTSNAVVRNGLLYITARPSSGTPNAYTSARLVTRDKKLFRYGKLEVKAKLPRGRGTWPAIWMLGSNIATADWPRCGEIDIMEHVGYIPDSVFSSVHTDAYNHIKGTQKTKGVFINNPYTSFHVYSIEWNAEIIQFFVDGVELLKFSNEQKTDKEWPFSQPFFLLLNVAVGGNWGGQQGVDATVFPAAMEVDWVRLYQRANP